MAEITAVCSQRWTWTLIPPVSAWCDRRGYNGGGRMGLAAAVPIVPPSDWAGQEGGHRGLWGG